MSLDRIETSAPRRHRIHLSHWAIRLLIALVLSMIILMFFFTSGAVSR
jgi:hypothetical protein